MSAWYIFSALGFYPVNPVSTEYVVGTYVASQSTKINRQLSDDDLRLYRPFFDKVTVHLPNAQLPLVISAPGASSKPYIKSLTIDGEAHNSPIIQHAQISQGAVLVFEMSDTPQAWASSTLQGDP